MNTLKTTAAAFVSGLLIGIAPLSATLASAAGDTVVASAITVQASSTYSAPAGLIEQLARRATDTNAKQANNCRSGHMYSAHDIVGDPESCIMQGAGVGGPFTPTAVVSAVR